MCFFSEMSFVLAYVLVVCVVDYSVYVFCCWVICFFVAIRKRFH